MHRISGYRAVEHTPEAAKVELSLGNAIGVGLAVYHLAWYNALAQSRGEITLPPMDTSGNQTVILDTYLGGHAVVLVGYRDNEVEDGEESHRPGGGYFLFRNSWGESWAPGNDYARGYGYLPYDYFRRFCLEAVVIDSLSKSGGKSEDRFEVKKTSTKSQRAAITSPTSKVLPSASGKGKIVKRRSESSSSRARQTKKK